MLRFTITAIMAICVVGMLGTANIHAEGNTAVSQSAPTPTPSGLFGSNTTPQTSGAMAGDIVFDFSSVPDPEIVDIYNGEVANGALTLTAPTEEDWAEVGFYISAQDYSIELDVTYTQFGPDFTWLYFLTRLQDDFCNVEMIYDPVTGETSGTVRPLNDCEDFTSLGDASGPAMVLNQTYRVNVLAIDNSYQIFIDGEAAGSWQDDSLSSGYVGIIGTVGPAQVTLDNINIRELSLDTSQPDMSSDDDSGDDFPPAQPIPGGEITYDFSSVPDSNVVEIYNGEVANGALTLTASEEDVADVGFYMTAQDYSIELDVTYTQYGPDATWLYFLTRIQDDFCNVEMIYDPVSGETSGTARLLNDCEDFTSLGDASGPAMVLNQTYRVNVLAIDNSYSIFIDGEAAGSWQDDSLSSGYVGIIGTLGPVQVTLDNITIRNLDQTTGRPTQTRPSGPRQPTPRATPSGDLFGG